MVEPTLPELTSGVTDAWAAVGFIIAFGVFVFIVWALYEWFSSKYN